MARRQIPNSSMRCPRNWTPRRIPLHRCPVKSHSTEYCGTKKVSWLDKVLGTTSSPVAKAQGLPNGGSPQSTCRKPWWRHIGTTWPSNSWPEPELVHALSLHDPRCQMGTVPLDFVSSDCKPGDVQSVRRRSLPRGGGARASRCGRDFPDTPVSRRLTPAH